MTVGAGAPWHPAPVSEAPQQPTGRPRGRPPRTAEQRAAQRSRLIAAVRRGLGEFGAEASIEDLAAVAGVSKPVLYDEFGDKFGIADAVAVALAEELEARVIEQLAAGGQYDIKAMVGHIIEALVDITEREPHSYAFIVRAIRTSDRGFLDNALVRAVHERSQMLIQLVAANVPEDRLAILLDGLFGFTFAAIESWHTNRTAERSDLIEDLSEVVAAGVAAVAAHYPSA